MLLESSIGAIQRVAENRSLKSDTLLASFRLRPIQPCPRQRQGRRGAPAVGNGQRCVVGKHIRRRERDLERASLLHGESRPQTVIGLGVGTVGREDGDSGYFDRGCTIVGQGRALSTGRRDHDIAEVDGRGGESECEGFTSSREGYRLDRAAGGVVLEGHCSRAESGCGRSKGDIERAVSSSVQRRGTYGTGTAFRVVAARGYRGKGHRVTADIRYCHRLGRTGESNLQQAEVQAGGRERKIGRAHV